jgi:glycerol-3-phosphate O-acyltransferase/dihydroxyacetone phosphate acyltransferase
MEKEECGSEEGPLIRVVGVDTVFARQIKVGDKVRPPGTAIALKTKKIVNDTELIVDGAEFLGGDMQLPERPVRFDILQKIDQKIVYEKVLDKLASGGTIGIFPEGGSHDRTDLLPLKVGVALIAFSSMEKDGINVPIVPVGLNYYDRHRFRGRAVVEYGRPVYVDENALADYKKGGPARRKVCNELLDRYVLKMCEGKLSFSGLLGSLQKNPRLYEVRHCDDARL